MISMSKAYSIRQPRMEGDSIAEISRKLEVSKDTVYKYLAMEDLSQRPPAPCAKASVLDRYRPLCLIRYGFHCTNERNHFSPMSVLCVVK